MSRRYDEYIQDHKNNVYRAFGWLTTHVSEEFTKEEWEAADYLCAYSHDESKYGTEEYNAYDKYFYGGNKSYEVVQNFNKAWLHHIHNNPHHWQHWVLINDDPDKGEIIIDMPNIYIIEMLCDWMSFSIAKGEPKEIFSWYDQHSKYMKLSDKTREKVESVLAKIKEQISEDGE